MGGWTRPDGYGHTDEQPPSGPHVPPKSGGAHITVDYGYDVHTILVPQPTLARIQAGVPLTTKGQGFPVEGVMEQDHWAFNYGVLGAIHVSTDMGRDVFEGNLGDSEVVVGASIKG